MKLVAPFMALLIVLQFWTSMAHAQDTAQMIPDGTTGNYFAVPKNDSVVQTKNLPANEFDGRYSTFKIGLGLIYDFTTYAQSDEFKRQMDTGGFNIDPHGQLRDFRVIGSGRLKSKRPISWKFAYMWDGDAKTWLVRESGVIVGVPELKGNIFVGRTKEGFSMIKVMNGHSGVTMERQMALDPIPIISDGIKYYGFLPKARVFWNLGYYNDAVSNGQKFSTFSWQYVARVGWMPFYYPDKNKLMHIAVNFRYARPVNGQITLKSRPESNPTPQILNTGAFQADRSSHSGMEAYYSSGRFMMGSEFIVHNFYSETNDDHRFWGGNLTFSYFFTKGRRPYSTIGSIYAFVPVKKSVFKGGLGEIEGVLNGSTYTLNSGTIHGGAMWRITPMINWYLSKVIRLEFVYGYGKYDRYQMKGTVQFFETRIQFSVL